MDLIYNYRQWLSLAAIVVSFVGTLVIIGRPSLRYFRGYIWHNQEIKTQIEEEATAVAFNRLAPDSREEQLADSIARGFITTNRSTFWGFLILLFAFMLQTLSVVSELGRQPSSRLSSPKVENERSNK